MKILADVAPYSRQFQTVRAQVAKRTEDNPELRAEYERVVDQVPADQGIDQVSPPQQKITSLALAGEQGNSGLSPTSRRKTPALAGSEGQPGLPHQQRRKTLALAGGTSPRIPVPGLASSCHTGRRAAPPDPRYRTFQGPRASPFQPEQGCCPTPKAARRRLQEEGPKGPKITRLSPHPFGWDFAVCATGNAVSRASTGTYGALWPLSGLCIPRASIGFSGWSTGLSVDHPCSNHSPPVTLRLPASS